MAYKFNPLVTDALNTEPNIDEVRYLDLPNLRKLCENYGFYRSGQEEFAEAKEQMLAFASECKATNHNLWMIAVSIIAHSDFDVEEGGGYDDVSYVMQLLANGAVRTYYGVTAKE